MSRFSFAVLSVLLIAGCAAPPPPAPVQLQPVAQAPVEYPGAIPVKDADVPPRPRRRVPPQYPVALRNARVTGKTFIDFVVGTDGSVVAASIFRADDIRLGEAARDAVLQWKWVPAEKNGRPVAVRMQVPIFFSLSY